MGASVRGFVGERVRTEASCFGYIDERSARKVVWKMKIFHPSNTVIGRQPLPSGGVNLLQTGFRQELRGNGADRAVIHVDRGVQLSHHIVCEFAG